MQRLGNPFPLFLDQHGDLLDAGRVYIGTANADPEVSPIAVYWDSAGTIEATQPLRTRGGVIVNNGSPAIVWIGDTDYSVRTRDADGNQVSYTKSVTDIGGGGGGVPSYQLSDPNLTDLSTPLSLTTFGKSLLGLVNSAALKATAGVTDGLPLTGGTVSGDIVRSGAGAHLYHSSATYESGRVITTANGAADPTTTVGDIWLELEP